MSMEGCAYQLSTPTGGTMGVEASGWTPCVPASHVECHCGQSVPVANPCCGPGYRVSASPLFSLLRSWHHDTLNTASERAFLPAKKCYWIFACCIRHCWWMLSEVGQRTPSPDLLLHLPLVIISHVWGDMWYVAKKVLWIIYSFHFLR